MSTPTLRQVELLRALDRLTARRGFAPSVRELGLELGIARANTAGSAAKQHLDNLQAMGLVVREHNVARSTRITAAGRRWLGRRSS